MMSPKDIETAKMMAEAWRLNDLRNKQIEEEKRQDKLKYRAVDDAAQE